MYVLTVDQVDSRHRPDAVRDVLADLRRTGAPHLVADPQRTAGDEFQAAFDDAATTLDAVLRLTRDGGWSVGLGVGPVDTPVPDDVREGSGAAFVAARRAVEAAKRSPTRCAVRVAGEPAAGDVGPLLDLLLALRARRTPEGWAVADLAGEGYAQKEMAARLGVTEQAVSARVRTADLRLEEAARGPLVRLLREADDADGGAE